MFIMNHYSFSLRAFSIGVIACAFSVLTSCDNNDDTQQVTVQEQDAADAISNSVTSDTGGLARTISQAVTYASDEDVFTDTPSVACGSTYTATYADSYDGPLYDFNYTIDRNTTLVCTDGAPVHLAFSGQFHGTYDTPRMSSDDSSTTSLIITGIGPQPTVATFNGTYVRNGSQQSKIRQMNSFTSIIQLTLTDVKVNKTTRAIVSGSADFTFQGQGTGGSSFNYSGTITFNGNGTATLVFNGGSFTIDL